LFGFTDAHQVARAMLRKKRVDFGGHFAGDFMRFADGEAANCVTRKINSRSWRALSRRRSGNVAPARFRIAIVLNCRRGAILLLEKIATRAARPLGGAFERGFGFVARGGSFNALIENHGDVRAEGELDFGGFFRSEKVFGAVEVRFEADAVVGIFFNSERLKT